MPLLNIDKWSIRTKIFLPTILLLSLVLLIYVVIFSNLFFQVKNDAFNDHKILRKIDHQIAFLGLSHNKISNGELTKLQILANSYLKQVLDSDGIDEKEELAAAQQIVKYANKYVEKYHAWLGGEDIMSVEKLEALKQTYLSLEVKLLNLVKETIEIVNNESDEDLETLFIYEVISAIILFILTLFLVAYGINFILNPVISLRENIERFRQGSNSKLLQMPEKSKGDELNQLIDSFSAMKSDITNKQTQLEQALHKAERANSATSEFLANISHELRTPMLGILGFAELGIEKLEHVEKEKLLKYFSRIHSSGSRLLHMVNNLLDLSQLESGHMTFKFKKHSVNKLIEEVLTELESFIKEKQLEVEIVSSESLLEAEFDEARIHQVIYNLIFNAIKFSFKEKKITLALSKELHHVNSTELSFIRISVTDQGIGIPELEVETIFEKFIQSSQTNTGAGGTGLGLSISKDICDYHNAKLWAENVSSPESGACFIMLLPVVYRSK